VILLRSVFENVLRNRNNCIHDWWRAAREFSNTSALFQYPVEKSCIEVLDPLVNADTNNHSDVEAFLNRVYAKICQLGVRMGVVFGNEQTVSLIWSQIAEYPNEHMWVLPFPGEFHFLVHVTHGIFRLYSFLLLPFANFLGRTKITVDFLSKYWHKQEDFLVMFIEGLLKWFQQIRGLTDRVSAEQVLKHVEKNKTAFCLLDFLFHHGLFYWNLRQQIRMGDVNAVKYAWKFTWPLFHVTNKFQYEKLCLIATYLQEFTHPAIREVLDKRLCNLKGIPGHFVGTDMVTEKVRSILWKIRELDSRFANLNSRIF
jgi:hypothetical protein